ncbi:MAG: hypothetical protein WC869_00945 [Phycisphaerae bacterium]|jgi:hypothetical protein
MDVNADTIKASADLASALSQFRTGLFIVLCVTLVTLGLGGAFMFFWFRRAMQRDQNRLEMQQKARDAEMEAAKQARAALYTQAQLEQAKSLAALATTINDTHAGTALMNQTTNKTLDNLGATMTRNNVALNNVAGAVQRMTDKVDGKLSREDSRKFIGAKLNSDMLRAICAIIEKSFTENHYNGREAFIADRVRSRIRDVLVAVRSELKSLPLAVSIDPYFPTTTDDLGERFILCDMIWAKVAPLFEDPRPVQTRMDEVTLIVENMIKDHVARVARRDHGSEMFEPTQSDTALLAKTRPAVHPTTAA